jgi:hypothetical protein
MKAQPESKLSHRGDLCLSDALMPSHPKICLSLGVTGHRAAHAGFADAKAKISATLSDIMDLLDGAVAAAHPALGRQNVAATRLHTLLADGTDRMAAEMALIRGYELVAPLPFGRRLNRAINSLPANAEDARSLLSGGDALDPATQSHATAIRALTDQAHVFSLADQDEAITRLFLAKMDAPEAISSAQLFSAECSKRVALAGRILIEQSDLVIAVWDGVTTGHIGGTGHTIETSLNLGTPVLWIDPACPEAWRLLEAPEALAAREQASATDEATLRLKALVKAVFRPEGDAGHPGVAALDREIWHPRSNRFHHAYRRVEALFAQKSNRSPLRSLTQTYETPGQIRNGSGAAMLSAAHDLQGADTAFFDRVAEGSLIRFAWADGIAAYLSDAYRGGMTVSFILSSLAIVGGIAYIPVVPSSQKWIFALFELLLLTAILTITIKGQRKRLHARWFETRRMAEYLRHAPILLALGAARSAGRWPRGTETNWPEWYVRHALRDIGLPKMVMSPDYLRGALTQLLDTHVTGQRDYHFAKAKRHAAVHHNLDHLSERLFQLAVFTVTLYLTLRAGSAFSLVSHDWLEGASKYFTVLGVLFPTFGAGIAGIRYFGDFERFAAISKITAEKLSVIHTRITVLAQAPSDWLHFGLVADLARPDYAPMPSRTAPLPMPGR